MQKYYASTDVKKGTIPAGDRGVRLKEDFSADLETMLPDNVIFIVFTTRRKLPYGY